MLQRRQPGTVEIVVARVLITTGVAYVVHRMTRRPLPSAVAALIIYAAQEALDARLAQRLAESS